VLGNEVNRMVARVICDKVQFIAALIQFIKHTHLEPKYNCPFTLNNTKIHLHPLIKMLNKC